MIHVVTNRNLQMDEKKGEKRFGTKFNPEGPDQLRIAKAKKGRKGWRVDVIDDVVKLDNGEEAYASEQAFREMQANGRNTLFFVHGFNTSFKDALETADELQKLYKVNLVLFTWPSNGDSGGLVGGLSGTLSYKGDKREAARSIQALDRVLERLNIYFNKYQQESSQCPKRTSLLMHSMGNWVFKNLLKSSVYSGETSVFDNVIMAAADVNNEGHEQWVDKIGFRRRLYITINEDDFALGVSRAKFGSRQWARLGHFSRNLNSRIATYLDFTDAKHVKEESHSYFRDNVVSKNANIKKVFNTILNGEAIENKLEFNTNSGAFVVK